VGQAPLRVEAYGAVDELNATLGVAAAGTEERDLRADLQRIQGLLFELGAYLATPDPRHREKSGFDEPRSEDVAALEARIDALDAELAPLRRFIVPGGHPSAAALHVARTVCRRAERRVLALHREEPVGAGVLRFLNRLSDALFTFARVANARAGVADLEWEERRTTE
jgi:cob(I)alamin adenosyltransferase